MARIVEAGYPPLMRDQAAALRAYARKHGRFWKRKLWFEWMNATAEPLLHPLRNTHSSTWLDCLMLASIPTVSEEENHAGQC